MAESARDQAQLSGTVEAAADAAVLDRDDRREPASVARTARPAVFRAFWQPLTPRTWSPLVVYLSSGSQVDALLDARRRMADWSAVGMAAGDARRPLAPGATVTIIPSMDGLRFNPPCATVQWLEDWHCVEFRMWSDAPLASTAEATVSFMVGPILIGELPLAIGATAALSAEARPLVTAAPGGGRNAAAVAYRNIFVSYSHDDEVIVRRLEVAYKAIGDDYLRDVSVLRSGEEWHPTLLAMIPSADIFQLCWSETARRSPHVEQEWRAALALGRKSFIRPLYWVKPLPTPPPELSHLHFTFFDLAAA